MLFVNFKTPDAVETAIEESNLDPSDRLKAKEILASYVRYGEQVTLKVDLKTRQVHVVRHS